MPGDLKPYPFGSIVQGADDRLRTRVYTLDEQRDNLETVWIVSSRDRGHLPTSRGVVRIDVRRDESLAIGKDRLAVRSKVRLSEAKRGWPRLA